MPISYIRPIHPAGPLLLVEIIELGPASPPPRPTPTPPDPNDPHPSHPISLPGDPGWGQIPGFGGPGGGPPLHPGDPGYPVRPHPEPRPQANAFVVPVPPPAEGQPPVTPPAGMPVGSVQVIAVLNPGPEQKATRGWLEPYVEHHPGG